ncbi:hypothetical protein [Bradyrhizobium genosp. P]|uniref:hypothetical protein n=1 Tax=Bradyrhizobium genosp. P TaxID=83641 RepID=UPI003CEBC224
MAIEIFDKFGKLRTDFSDAEIAGLTEDQRNVFAELVATALQNQEHETELIVAQRGVPAAMRAADKAHAAHRLAHPPQTHQQAMQAVIDANRRAAGIRT